VLFGAVTKTQTIFFVEAKRHLSFGQVTSNWKSFLLSGDFLTKSITSVKCQYFFQNIKLDKCPDCKNRKKESLKTGLNYLIYFGIAAGLKRLLKAEGRRSWLNYPKTRLEEFHNNNEGPDRILKDMQDGEAMKSKEHFLQNKDKEEDEDSFNPDFTVDLEIALEREKYSSSSFPQLGN